MKIATNQLDLFKDAPVDYAKLVFDRATGLLDLLNMDIKPKEQYKIQYYFQEDIYIILIASNRHKDMLCNCIDIYGNTPDGFCVNWGDFGSIKQSIETVTGKPMKL